MKSDRRQFLLARIRAALIIVVGILATLFVFDVLLNGLLLKICAVLIGNLLGGMGINRNLLFCYGMVVLLLIVCAYVWGAYKTYTAQHGMYLEAKTEAERARELAEMEMQRKSDLITYLAHDLKTPLASVIAYLNLLSDSPDLSPEQRGQYVGITLDKANRLEQLMEELFDIIRFNLQTMVLQEERIHLKLMLDQLADEFFPILLPQGKRIAVQCAEEITLRGDPDKLARVFNNILKNAVAYSHADTEIGISVHAADRELEIRFRNHGDPIPKQKQQIIFEKFYRLDVARGTKSGGAGLGLAIAKEIVQAHGGGISVESSAAGTVFAVRLPWAKGSEKEMEQGGSACDC